MKSFSLFLSLAVVICIILQDQSTEAKEICLCHNHLGVGGGRQSGTTQKCGGSDFSCYMYGGNFYCEVENLKRKFEECCKDYGHPIKCRVTEW